MNELKIELMGKGKHWSFAKREIRIGRDVRGEVVFAAEEYPMISRNHLLISFEGGRCWVEDLKTRGGTFLNGTRIERAAVSPGDVVRLSSDGPELRLLFSALLIPGKSSAASASQSAGEIPTRILPPHEGAGRPHDDLPTSAVQGQKTGPKRDAGEPAGAWKTEVSRDAIPDTPAETPALRSKIPPAGAAFPEAPLSSSEKDVSRTQKEPLPAASSATSHQEREMNHRESDSNAPEGLTKTDVMLMEKKLGGLRNLVTVLLAMIVVLGGMLLNQNRLIERNRKELGDLKKDAFEQLMPRLNQKAKELDARFERTQSALDLMDGKIKEAEDRFVRRLNVELPGILDRELPKIVNKYIDKKMRDVQGSTPLPVP